MITGGVRVGFYYIRLNLRAEVSDPNPLRLLNGFFIWAQDPPLQALRAPSS